MNVAQNPSWLLYKTRSITVTTTGTTIDTTLEGSIYDDYNTTLERSIYDDYSLKGLINAMNM